MVTIIRIMTIHSTAEIKRYIREWMVQISQRLLTMLQNRKRSCHMCEADDEESQARADAGGISLQKIMEPLCVHNLPSEVHH